MQAKLALWRLAAFGDFREKSTEKQVVLLRNFSGPVSATDPVKSSKDTSNLVPCTRKKVFGWGEQIFC